MRVVRAPTFDLGRASHFLWERRGARCCVLSVTKEGSAACLAARAFSAGHEGALSAWLAACAFFCGAGGLGCCGVLGGGRGTGGGHPELPPAFAAGSSHAAPAVMAAALRAWHSRFYTMANLPADAVNIVSALEAVLEQGWPAWLKVRSHSGRDAGAGALAGVFLGRRVWLNPRV